MPIDKKTFLKTVTILHDTREQKNAHIIEALDKLGVKHEERKLDYGDYSFTADGRDFSMSCVVERKANVDEIYNNVTSDRGRIEKELYSAAQLAKQLTLFIEGVVLLLLALVQGNDGGEKGVISWISKRQASCSAMALTAELPKP